ncbi:hypothetical protein DFH09DRAFT_1324984 [Mycena vulgaris]|nr:hypothetical protein DFH09DRAFT_1324984 [Mycena vulgaris]
MSSAMLSASFVKRRAFSLFLSKHAVIHRRVYHPPPALLLLFPSLRVARFSLHPPPAVGAGVYSKRPRAVAHSEGTARARAVSHIPSSSLPRRSRAGTLGHAACCMLLPSSLPRRILFSLFQILDSFFSAANTTQNTEMMLQVTREPVMHIVQYNIADWIPLVYIMHRGPAHTIFL